MHLGSSTAAFLRKMRVGITGIAYEVGFSIFIVGEGYYLTLVTIMDCVPSLSYLFSVEYTSSGCLKGLAN
jgi:hypothetical protein